jgi:GTP-binding protein EngB required for normal cell division
LATKDSDFSSQRLEIEKTGQTILEIANQTNNTGIADFTGEVLDKLSKEEFYLAILGLFKRGKSTLINALLGQQIVPTGVIPVTSVITRIRYGADLKSKIRFSDGTEKELPVESLKEYVTEEGNPNNSKNVVIADIYVPAAILKGGLILIDTPGVGSTYLSGTTTTFQFLDRVDFAVFVLAVDPPVGQQELDLLGSLASKSSKILFVLNKIDYVNASDVAVSVEYCHKVINQHLKINADSPFTVYPMSAKAALDGRLHGDVGMVERSGINKFEVALKQSLLADKESFILESAGKKLEKAISDLKTYINIELASLTMPLENLSKLVEEFEQYLTLVDKRKRELFYVLDGRAKEVVTMLDEDLNQFKKEHEPVLISRVWDYAQQNLQAKDTTSRKVTNTVNEYLKKTLIEIYSEFIRSEDLRVQQRFQLIVDDTNTEVNRILGDVKRKAEQLFGFQTATPTFEVSLDFETRFYYHLDPLFFDRITISSSEIAELLPKSLFKGVLKKRIEESARSEFDKNGGRIRYDYFVTRFNQAVIKLRRDINSALDASTETVQKAVQEAQQLRSRGETEVAQSCTQLNKMLSDLESAHIQVKRSTCRNHATSQR